MEPEPKIKTLLVDDEPLVRQGIREFLEDQHDVGNVARPPNPTLDEDQLTVGIEAGDPHRPSSRVATGLRIFPV